jgi:recombination protein RecR
MSKLLPASIKSLVGELAKLPGVGERTALRYAVHLLKAGGDRIENLSRALSGAQLDVSHCSHCFFWIEKGHCPLCSDEHRPRAKLCVVRDCPDVLALEKFKSHPWSYHVLQGLLSPLGGVGPLQIRFDELMHRIEVDGVNDIILALDATVEGDATALFIKEQVRSRYPTVQLSRTAMGLPAGASLEYLDPSTLENALVNRTHFE